MSQTLRDFINSREAEIKASIKALNVELQELRAARTAIEGGDAQGGEDTGIGRMKHRDMIMSVLHDHPDGGTADSVIEWVREDFQTDIPQASMSSQLSRAKSAGLLTLDTRTKIWRSAKHTFKENEPPKGGSETEEGDTSSITQSETGLGLPSVNYPDP